MTPPNVPLAEFPEPASFPEAVRFLQQVATDQPVAPGTLRAVAAYLVNLQERRLVDARVISDLRDKLAQCLAGKVTLEELTMGAGGTHMKLNAGVIAEVMATAFHDMIQEQKAENYVEMQLMAPDGHYLTVTLQKHDGQTPHQLREAAEFKLMEMESRYALLHEQHETLLHEVKNAVTVITGLSHDHPAPEGGTL